MEIILHKDYESMSKAAAKAVVAMVNAKPDSTLCLPSGDTPKRLFQLLVEYQDKNLVSFDQCCFVGLDEWLGFSGRDEGGCRFMLDRDFFGPAGIDKKQIFFFDGKASSPEQECRRIEGFLQSKGGIDIMILGLGLNGHLGLNEPGTDFNLRSHITKLTAITKETAAKYRLDSKDLQNGITLGPADIMDVRTVLLLASGKAKAPIIKKLLEEPAAPQIPASILKKHQNSFLYVDEAAYTSR